MRDLGDPSNLFLLKPVGEVDSPSLRRLPEYERCLAQLRGLLSHADGNVRTIAAEGFCKLYLLKILSDDEVCGMSQFTTTAN